MKKISFTIECDETSCGRCQHMSRSTCCFFGGLQEVNGKVQRHPDCYNHEDTLEVEAMHLLKERARRTSILSSWPRGSR